MGRIYFFPSQTVVHNDKVFPVILALAHQGHHVETVILSGETAFSLMGDDAYAQWLRTLTRVRYCAFDRAVTVMQRLIVRIRFARLLLALVVRRGYVAFFDARPASQPVRMLSRLAKRNGTSVVYTAWYCDPLRTIDWKAMLADPERQRRLRKVGSPSKEVPPIASATTVLCYHPDEVAKYDQALTSHVRLLPHPKLQPWWRAFMAARPPHYDQVALSRAERWVAVFLTYRGNYIFREDSDADVLLAEILQAVRRVFPDVLIAVKTKVNVARWHEEWFTEIVRRHGDAQTIFTTTPVAFLAERAIAGISTGHSTAQFEFMASTAPWVEYCRYSDFWTSIFPQKTYTPQYGGTWVETPDALEGVLRNLERHRGDRKRYEEILAFREQPLSLDFFRPPA